MAPARLIGRDEDVATIRDALVSARAGEPRCVLVTGEAGIGKSRLVVEAVERMVDALVVVGHAAEMSTGEIAFGVLADTLRHLTRVAGDDVLTPPERDILAPLLPGAVTGSAGVDRLRLLSTFVDVLQRLSLDRLLVWVVEDLHWADSATRDVVNLAVRTLRGSFLLIATVRTDDPDRGAQAEAELVSTLAGLARAAGCVRVSLGPLTEPEVREQLAALLGTRASARTTNRIHQLSDGIPFVVEELASAAGRPELSTAGSVAGGRLAGLSPDARRLVDAAAVGDGHLRTSLLEEVVEATPREFDASLLEAVRVGILVSDATADQVGFRHALLRDATDRAMGPGARRAWHRRWAEVLEAHPGVLAGDPCTLAIAEHWHHAKDVRRSVGAAMSALEAAARIGDDRAELRLWTRVVSSWESLERPEEVVGCGLRDAVASVLIGPPGSHAEFVQFLDSIPAHLLTALEQGALSVHRALTGEAKGELAARYRGQVIDLFDRFDVFDQPRDAFSVVVLTLGSRLPRADLRGPRAMDLAAEISRELGSKRARMQEVSIRSHSRQFSGDPSGAADYLESQLEQFGDLPDDEVGFLEGNLMWCRITEGDHVRAQEVGERSLARLRHPQLSTQLWEHLVENYAFSLMCTGEWARARELLETSDPWWEDNLRSSNIRLSMLDLFQGHDPDVERWRHALGMEIPGGAPQVSVRHLIAAEAVARGDLDTARATYTAMWQDREILVLDDYLWLVIVEAARAEADAVAVATDRATHLAATHHVTLIRDTAASIRHYGVLSEVWPLDLAAQLDRFHGRDARPTLEAALAGWERIGHVPDVAVTHLSLAEAHALVGDREEARRHLVAGRDIAERLEARPMLDRADALAERFALAARERRTSDVLTAREAEVLALIAEGRTNAEIAGTLFMSPKTASVHVSHIIAKLGAANRTEAAAMARRHGLLQ